MSSDCSPGATAFSPRMISLERHSGARVGANPDSRACHLEIPGSRPSGGAKAPIRWPRPGMTFEIGPPFTIQPRLVCNNHNPLGELGIMRGAIAIIGLLAGGCAGDVSTIDQPSMYISMANGGAKLDPEAAASMISLYRQNNGLGGVAVDPELMKLAESQSQSKSSQNKREHHVKAPLAQRPDASWYPSR